MDDHNSLGGGDPASHDSGMEARLARVESDIGHVRSDTSEIKSLLARLAPRIDEIYGKLPFLATKEDLARLELGTKQEFARLELGTKRDLASTKQDLARFELRTTEELARLAAEIEKRPTRRQTMVDVAMIVGLIGTLITLGTRLAQ